MKVRAKRYLSFLLAICLLLSAAPASGFAATHLFDWLSELLSVTSFSAATVASGTCGEDSADAVSWSLNSDGVLTISGTGKMASYSAYSSDQPWSSHNSEIKKAVVSAGVTKIGAYAFYNCSVMETVSLPNSVTEMGSGVFYDCYALKSAVIPSGMTKIPAYTFYYCSALETVTIPKTVTEIGYEAFQYCRKLTAVTIPSGLTVLDSYAFYSTGLTSIQIPGSLKTIEYAAFGSCTDLKTITIQEGVETIEERAFSDCTALTSVTIPASVTSIGGGVFSSCTNLTAINVASSNTAYTSVNGLLFSKDKKELLLFPLGKVNSTGSYTIPNTVSSVGDYAFYKCSTLKKIVIPTSVTSIGEYAFADCDGLTQITVPNSVTALGKGVFNDCDALEQITLSEKLTSIGESAFRSCDKLSQLEIPNSVTTIGSETFSYCYALKSVTLPSGLQTIGYEMFYYCSALPSIKIPASVTSIGSSAFYGCAELTAVTLPKNVTSIGTQAFAGCKKLTGINVASGSTTYNSVNGVLYNKERTTLVLYPAGKTETAFSVPGSVLTIGSSAFRSCSVLTKVTIPDSVTKIEDSAFYDCDALVDISLPASVLYLGSDAFSSCGKLTRVVFNGGITTVPYECFEYDNNLQVVYLPKTVTNISSYAFNSCSALTDVYYSGTEAEWKKIEISSSNTPLASETIRYHYNATQNNNPVYIVDYNLNGGYSGTTPMQVKHQNTDLTLSSIVPTYFGHTFLGWNTTASAVKAAYQPGDKYTKNANLTLYAVWSHKTLTAGNDPIPISYTGDEAESEYYYQFTPSASGTYVIYSTGSENTYVTLYSGEGNYIADDRYSGENNNFKMENDLEAGKTYYYKIQLYRYYYDENVKSGSFSVLFNLKSELAYKVNYKANGGKSAPSAQKKYYDVDLTLSSEKPTRTYKLTYNANGGTVSPAYKNVSVTFISWNTSADGSGTTYAPGAVYNQNKDVTLYARWVSPEAGTLAVPKRDTYDFDGWYTAATGGAEVTANTIITEDATLYAHWIPKQYTITYNANGGTDAPDVQYKSHGVNLTLTNDVPTKFGEVFVGWATTASATSAAYKPGQTYTANANTTLYAVWSCKTLTPGNTATTVSFTATGEKKYCKYTPTSTAEYVIYSTGSVDTAVDLYAADGTLLASNDDGGDSGNFRLTSKLTAGTTYYFRLHFVEEKTGNMSVVFNLKNAETAKTYTVTFNGNGGTGAPAAQKKTQSVALTLTTAKPAKTYKITFNANSGNVTPASKTVNVTFKGWNTAANGTGTAYAAGGNYLADANVTLYAQWTNPKAGELPTPTRSGYSFDGWYTAASGGTKVTKDTTITKNLTLYTHWKEIPKSTYIVTYNANGGTGAPVQQTKNQGVNLTLSTAIPAKSYTVTYSANGGATTTAGKNVKAVFKGWNTAANGSGTAYAAGAVYKANANVTLYAQWTNPKAGDLAKPTRSGYSFDGWYTAATGGTVITADTVISKSQTIYAHWTEIKNYKVTYNANGGTGAPAQQFKKNGVNLTLSGTRPEKTYTITLDANGGVVSTAKLNVNLVFKAWNTKADGKGTSYQPGGIFKADADATLYAQWTNPKAGELVTPTRDGYTFAGWYTEKDGGSSFTKDSTVTKSLTLYAHWNKIEKNTFVVTYNANGGVGAPAQQIKTQGVNLTLSNTKPAKSYVLTFDANGGTVSPDSKTVSAAFKNWNTKADGKGTAYSAAGVYKNDANATLYAQWANPKLGELFTPTRSGYIFDGWFTAPSDGAQVNENTTITKSQTLYAHWSKFVWGKDNWNFINDDRIGDFPSGSYRSQINDEYQAALKQGLSHSEYYAVFGMNGKNKGKIDNKWVGSCYGMSVLMVLANKGFIPYGDYTKNATSLYALSKPNKNPAVASLITYYHMLQYKDIIQQQYRIVPYRSNETNINEIMSLIDQSGMVLISFVQKDFGGHAIVAYDYEFGSYTFNNNSYQGCIKICDPNNASSYSRTYNIYFNTQTYDWIIPAYLEFGVNSLKGARFYYIGSDVDSLNAGGYLSGVEYTDISSFVARMDAPEISLNRTVNKISQAANGDYVTMSAGPNEIIADYSYVLGDAADATFGYNLYDAASAYQVQQDDPAPIDLQMDYQICDLSASSAAGKKVIFDPKGYVEIESNKSGYDVSLTFDQDYPTQWFYVAATGAKASSATLQKTEDGYLLKADDLKDTTVTVGNMDQLITLTFSATEKEVLICALDENTVGVMTDKNGDGVFETKLVSGTENSTVPGDVTGDGAVTAEDARLALRAAVSLENYAKGSPEFLAADANKDGAITAEDARLILRAAVGLETLT